MHRASLQRSAGERLPLNAESETLSTRCSSCSKRLRVRRVHLNKHVRCPRCGRRTLVIAPAYLGFDAPPAEASRAPRRPQRYAALWMVLLAATFASLGVFAGRMVFG